VTISFSSNVLHHGVSTRGISEQQISNFCKVSNGRHDATHFT